MNHLEQKRINSPEIEKKIAVGVGLIIVHAQTGEIWAIEELKEKDRTGRVAGSLSVPMETRKIGETVHENLLGAMAEVFDDSSENSDTVYSSFFTLDKTFICNVRPLVLSENGRTLLCDVGIVFFEGERADMKPYDETEVRAYGWIGIQDFLLAHTRSVARVLVESVSSAGIIVERLKHYRETQDKGYFFFPPGFSISNNFVNREALPDMVFDRVYE